MPDVTKSYPITSFICLGFLAPPAEGQRSFSNADLSVVRLTLQSGKVLKLLYSVNFIVTLGLQPES